jgi:hypothetical protein
MDYIQIPKDLYVQFFKAIGILLAVIFGYEMVFRFLLKSKLKIFKALLLLLKILFWGLLLFLTLFFDYRLRTIVLTMPKYITFTQLIMIPMTGFEMLSNLMDLIEECTYVETKKTIYFINPTEGEFRIKDYS